jgi:hypothetical protein
MTPSHRVPPEALALMAASTSPRQERRERDPSGRDRRPRARWAVAAATAVLAVGVPRAESADVEGTRDPPLPARFPGAVITDYTVRERDVAAFQVESGRVVQVEGRLVLVRYRYPPGSGCAEILGKHEAALRESRLRVAGGTRLQDEVVRGLGGPEPEGWVSGVGTAPGGTIVHVLAACAAGALAPVGPVLLVESRPMTLRGRPTARPVFDSAPSRAAEDRPRVEGAERVLRCPPRVSVTLGAIAPVETGEDAADPDARWVASFAPPSLSRTLDLSDGAIEDGKLACRYRDHRDADGQAVTLGRSLPVGRTCTRRGGGVGEFTCVRR